MPRTRSSLGWAVVAAVVVAAGGQSAPAPADPTRRDADDYARRGQWEQACDAYARLLAADRRQPEVRERLQHCLRRLSQARRHRDPVFKAKVLSLPTPQALALYADVLGKLQTYYVDRDRVPARALFRHGLDEFLAALAEPTFRQEHLGAVEPSALAGLRDQLRTEWANRDVADVNDARNLVRELARDVQRLIGLPPTVAVLEFACGACHALDEYTVFLTPGQPLDDPSALSGELAAYGLLLNWRDGKLVIDRVLPNTWAAAMGVQAGDRVTHLGKQALSALSADLIADLLRGESAPVTELTVLGSGGGRLLTLPGYAPSIPEALIEREGVGYIRLANFQRTTPQELESALLRLRSEGMRALVLDLRGNPGGSFAAAVQVAERFLPQGVIVSTHGQARGASKVYSAQNPLTALDVPLVVLIDGDTASAAEVVAGALKDHLRALLIGTRTFGKGTIQCLLTLQAGSGLRLTLARFVSPRGHPFAGVGIAPHIVEPRTDPTKDVPLEVALEHAARLAAMK